MWNRITLRTRIVLLSATCLLLVCAVLTVYLVTSAGKTFAVPYTGLALTVPRIAASAAVQTSQASQTAPMAPLAFQKVSSLALSTQSTAVFLTNASTVYETVQTRYSCQSYLFTAVIFLTGLLLIWVVTGRALRPVARLSRRIEAVDERNLSEPLDVPDSEDELARLTVSFNHMLQKVGAAYDAQKRFAQNAAHELKTPVASILANIEVTELGEASPEELREALDAAKENARRMETLIADMITLNASPDTLEYADVRFSALLADITRELAEALAENDVSITLTDDVTLHGNRALLLRAFSNILHNAIRYNRRGGRIDVACTPRGVTICDTGIGIAPEMLDKVFEPFFCADASRAKALGGSGLGLSIAKQILEKHGMRIAIESGQGTTVSVFTGRSWEN